MTSKTVYLQHRDSTVKMKLERKKGKIIIRSKEVWLGDNDGATAFRRKEK